jgi:hypothetical protein
MKDLGLMLGGVVVCTALFIWNQIEMLSVKAALLSATKELVENRKVLSQIVEGQQQFVAKISEQQNALATNQLNLTNSVNEVVRELIGIIREATEKS